MLANLGIRPTSGWSVDPFGHGSTQPYILATSGITGTVIQRIHYAWKQWLALKQQGDFLWVPNWQHPSLSTHSLLTHNQPFDIYSIKHSCGPHPYVCLNFDFRKVVGEYTEYSIKAQQITDANLKEKSELLLEQYQRTGSLFVHNVVLMPLGDDFRYNVADEWDQQYSNYAKIIEHINTNKDLYKGAEITFGTPSDYFRAIRERTDQYATLKGDFFVYSDIFSEGRPAYWSGYFTTRPFMKTLGRQCENNLRAAEILYTVALNNARQKKNLPCLKILEKDFEKLVRSRRNLGLFQHHDAITGTSKSFVMRDYGLKLFESIRDTTSLQEDAIRALMLPDLKPDRVNIVLSDLERESYDKLPRKTPVNFDGTSVKKRQIVLYNSLAQPQEHLVQIRTNTTNVKILDPKGDDVVFQINPVWDLSDSKPWIVADEFEVIFVAKLPELSLMAYSIVYTDCNKDKMATIYCNNCRKKTNIGNTDQADNISQAKFPQKTIPTGDIQLENSKLKLLFSGTTGFLKTVTRKHNPKIMQCGIHFAAYHSAQFHSGAYLFMPDPNENEMEKDVLQQYKNQMTIVITSGPVASDVTVIYGPFLIHTVTILHVNSTLADAILLENTIDFESPPKNRETELFMRLVSDIQNGEPPEFYTDSNGFQMQKRIKIDKINIEGNYFPITTMTYVEDDDARLTLLTDHAAGAASWQPGFLEVMLERRTLYDDSRGMGEGLVDNRKTVNKFWILIEDKTKINASNKDVLFETGDEVRSFNVHGATVGKPEVYSMPSLYAHHLSNMLNYPVGIFILDVGEHEVELNQVKLLSDGFPCDTHLLTLRTQPDPVYTQFPSANALMVLHRQGYDCGVNRLYECKCSSFNTRLNYVHLKKIQATSLTGVDVLDDNVQSFSDIVVDSMALKTFNLSFT